MTKRAARTPVERTVDAIVAFAMRMGYAIRTGKTSQGKPYAEERARMEKRLAQLTRRLERFTGKK